jgi:hypothetical protein
VSDPTSVFPAGPAPEAPGVSVTMLLADSAQVAEGKLFVLGGGITVVGPRPQPLAVALVISVPWDRANVSHQWVLELLDEDGHSVPDTERPVVVGGRFEAGRPAGTRPGTPLPVPLAINFSTLPLHPGRSYVWQLRIDERSRDEWRAAFFVRTAAS